MAEGYAALPNERVRAASGVEYACRDTGGGAGAGDDRDEATTWATRGAQYHAVPSRPSLG